MKVVIDIDNEMYKYICKHYTGEDTAYLAIKNGLVLADNFLYPPAIWWNGYDTGKVIGEKERPKGECKDCKYYFAQVGRCENCKRNHQYSDNFQKRI